MRDLSAVLAQGFRQTCLALVSLLGFFWLVDGPTRLRLPLVDEHLYLVVAGLVTAAGLLSRPFGQRAGALEIVLGIDNIVFISILASKLPAARRR